MRPFNSVRLFVAITLLSTPAAWSQSQPLPTVAEELPAFEVLPTPDFANQSNESQPESTVSILETESAPENRATRSMLPATQPESQGITGNMPDPQSTLRTIVVLGEPYEVLSRGPIHEAFAIPSNQSEKGALSQVRMPPPNPIQEVEAADQPEGKNIQWIEGYWSFLDDASAFVWVSGLYRDVPPGRSWTPGYWVESQDGYRRISGYWAAEEAGEARLPAPPASRDRGAEGAAPSTDSFWLPGEWNYVDNKYVWKSGYWTQQYADWIWQPTYFIETESGSIRVPGYWDYEPKYRGTLFAPIAFRAPQSARWRFRPVYTVGSPAALLLHMFVKSGDNQFFYGDYYTSRSVSLGYKPWYSVSSPAFTSASLLGYYNWKLSKQGLSFANRMARYTSFFRANQSERPIPEAANSFVARRVVLPPSRFGTSLEQIASVSPTLGRTAVPNGNIASNTTSSPNSLGRTNNGLTASQQARILQDSQTRPGQRVDIYGRPINENGYSQGRYPVPQISNRQPQTSQQQLSQQRNNPNRLPTVAERSTASRAGATPYSNPVTAASATVVQPLTLRDRIRARVLATAPPTLASPGVGLPPTLGARVIAPPSLTAPRVPGISIGPSIIPSRIIVSPGIGRIGIPARPPVFAPRFGRRW